MELLFYSLVYLAIGVAVTQFIFTIFFEEAFELLTLEEGSSVREDMEQRKTKLKVLAFIVSAVIWPYFVFFLLVDLVNPNK